MKTNLKLGSQSIQPSTLTVTNLIEYKKILEVTVMIDSLWVSLNTGCPNK